MHCLWQVDRPPRLGQHRVGEMNPKAVRALSASGNQRHIEKNFMAFDLSNTLVVGISATALFDMSESDQMFKAALEVDSESVIDNYRRYMR